MRISPDELIFFQYGWFKLSGTLVFTWLVMLVLVVISVLITRRLKTDISVSKWQCALEIVVLGIQSQLEEAGLKGSLKFIGFVGTLFLFIFTANLLTIFPYFEPPTGSLSTTAALALCVFFAVPYYGIAEKGLLAYLKSYFEPTPFMMPFHIIGEFSRTLALAVRLFGNMMSGSTAIMLILSISPLIFPIIMTLLGLLVGSVQAYIFSTLAVVYLASATSASEG